MPELPDGVDLLAMLLSENEFVMAHKNQLLKQGKESSL